MPGLRKAFPFLHSVLLLLLAFQCDYIGLAHATPGSPDATHAVCGDGKCTSLLSAILPSDFEVKPRVQAIPKAHHPAQMNLKPGRYCIARLSKRLEENGNEVELSNCMFVHPGRGLLELVSETAMNTPTVYTVQNLTRGASLLQFRQANGAYLFYVAILREHGLVFLPVPLLATERDAAPAGIQLSLAPGALQRLRKKTGFEPFGITSGAPEKVLRWVRNQVGRQIDVALRNHEIGTRLTETPVYLVRVEQAATANVPVAMVLVQKLHTAIIRAMILE